MYYVDLTQTSKQLTGIERVTTTLFASGNREKSYRALRSGSKISAVFKQWVVIPLIGLLNRKATFIFPAFPPSIFASKILKRRAWHYVHDLFLEERVQDLNLAGRYYMRPSFRYAVRHLDNFLVNSEYTKSALSAYVKPAAKIHLLRPSVPDVFGIEDLNPRFFGFERTLRVLALGTIEPRKNLRYGVEICRALSRKLGRPVTLDVVGRKGWGDDYEWLSEQTDVTLHGYCGRDDVANLIHNASFLLAASKDEGLGLPLLEVQHAGLMVVATDIPPFREVLAGSGCLIPLNDSAKAADLICGYLDCQDLSYKQNQSKANVARWNEIAVSDKKAFEKNLTVAETGK